MLSTADLAPNAVGVKVSVKPVEPSPDTGFVNAGESTTPKSPALTPPTDITGVPVRLRADSPLFNMLKFTLELTPQEVNRPKLNVELLGTSDVPFLTSILGAGGAYIKLSK
jgi:hypothetical protein